MRIFIFLFLLILLSIPRVTDNIIIQFIPLSILGLFVFYLLNKVNLKKIKVPKYVFLMILIVAVALIRTNNPDTTSLVTIYKLVEFTLFMTAMFLHNALIFQSKKLNFLDTLFNYIITPFTIYCLLNLIFWTLGIKFSNQYELIIGKTVMLSNFGIQMDRVQFPFASGINAFACVVGGAFFLALSYFFYSTKNKILSLFSIIIIVTILLLLDSRTSLIYPIISLILVHIIRFAKWKKILFIFPFLPFLLPVVLLFIMQLIQQSGAINLVSRETEDVATANGRLIIWGFSLMEILNFKLIHLIGFGQYGHYASGASKSWASMFGKWKNSELTHPHNSVLMIFFDYGYLGLLLFVLMLKDIFYNIIKYWESNHIIINTILGFMIYFLLIGISESFFGLYYLNALYVFFSVVVLAYSYFNYQKNNQNSN